MNMKITDLKIKTSKSFSRSDPCDLFHTFDIDNNIQNINRSCKTCQNQIINDSNDYCSLQCYKNSKKDNDGYYNITCMNCEKQFKTKCIFTDFCSDNCFNQIRQKPN